MHYYRVHTFVTLNVLQVVKIFAVMYYLYYEYFTIHQEEISKTSQPTQFLLQYSKVNYFVKTGYFLKYGQS